MGDTCARSAESEEIFNNFEEAEAAGWDQDIELVASFSPGIYEGNWYCPDHNVSNNLESPPDWLENGRSRRNKRHSLRLWGQKRKKKRKTRKKKHNKKKVKRKTRRVQFALKKNEYYIITPNNKLKSNKKRHTRKKKGKKK